MLFRSAGEKVEFLEQVYGAVDWKQASFGTVERRERRREQGACEVEDAWAPRSQTRCERVDSRIVHLDHTPSTRSPRSLLP